MKKVFIIAEAGVNHNGDFILAKKLIDIAKFSGADAVKFQTFKAKNEISKMAPKADYQKELTNQNETQLEMVKKLEFSYAEFLELADYCKEKEIIFLSSAFDLESVDFLSKLDMPFFKIPSGLITNLPYLTAVSKQQKPIILSTGMSDMKEIEEALKIIKKYNNRTITLLHCNTQYPTPIEDVNLNAMLTLGKKFLCPFGYSDHTLGITVPIAAAVLGASVIEKHFTIDKNLSGPDHKASLEPEELEEMVNGIRAVQKALGSGEKIVTKSEAKNRNIARTSIVAAKNIKKGEPFSELNITTKRPGTGISPMKWPEVLGKTAKKDFDEDELIIC